jgi:malonyl-CoA O-methyltransferase
MNSKDIIRKNFSRCARVYDSYSAVQDKAARELIERLNGLLFAEILDIGCGTGNYTSLLRERFPDSHITALDVSPEMLEVAAQKLGDGIDFVAADGETSRTPQTFDLITSNACFQWFDSLQTALSNCAVSLRKDGLILFSAFGPATYQELAACLGPVSASAFLDADRIAEAMARSFENVRVREHGFTETYGTLRDLLDTIKYTGTRGLGTSGRAIGRQRLAELEDTYRAKFGEIIATCQIFFCCGRKRGSK